MERAWLRARVWGCDKHLENTELRVTRMHAHLSGAKHFPLPRPLDNPGVPGQKYTQTVRLPIFMCSNVHNGYRERLHAVELSALILFSKSRVLGRRFDIGILALTFSCRYCKFRISTVQCSLCTLSLPDVSLSRGGASHHPCASHKATQVNPRFLSCTMVCWFMFGFVCRFDKSGHGHSVDANDHMQISCDYTARAVDRLVLRCETEVCATQNAKS